VKFLKEYRMVDVSEAISNIGIQHLFGLFADDIEDCSYGIMG